MTRSASGRRRRARRHGSSSRVRTILAVLLAVVVLATGVVLVRSYLAREGVSGETTVTASSTAFGSSPVDAVTPGGGGWRASGETDGAWIELGWSSARAIDRMTIVRDRLDVPGVTDGVLGFSDGSSVQVRLSTTSPSTTVAFTPRAVTGVRFTVAGVAPDTDAAVVEHLEVASSGGSTEPPPADGDVAPRATATQSVSSGGSDPRALLDGSGVAGAAGAAGTGSAWTVPRPQGAWVELAWADPQELTSVEVVGDAGSPAELASGTLTFSDGATLPLGAVTTDPSRPTILSFLPRSTTSLRLTVDTVGGTGTLGLGELRVYPKGATPVRTVTGPAPPGADGPPAPAPCTPLGPVTTLTVRCPAGDSAVDGTTTVTAALAPGYTSVRAVLWPADPATPAGLPVYGTPDASGQAELPVDASSVDPGPFTVELVATGARQSPQAVYLTLYRSGERSGAPVAAQPQAGGRTLVYDEEFDRPVSLSRTGAGADYAASQPSQTEGRDFGEAPFANPSAGLGTVGTTDGLLRLALRRSDGRPDYPAGDLVGGMLASARAGGSGFSAQYGYFESRIFTPVAPGTWPAFWTLPSDNLITKQRVFAEIDAVERYGKFPRGTCQSTHTYLDEKDTPNSQCNTEIFDSERAGLGWHTYAVDITPTQNVFFIDGKVVATAPQVPGGASPMFFMLDLAAGGGWPVDLGVIGDRAAMYVDYVRVYV